MENTVIVTASSSFVVTRRCVVQVNIVADRWLNDTPSRNRDGEARPARCAGRTLVSATLVSASCKPFLHEDFHTLFEEDAAAQRDIAADIAKMSQPVPSKRSQPDPALSVRTSRLCKRRVNQFGKSPVRKSGIPVEREHRVKSAQRAGEWRGEDRAHCESSG